MSAFRYMRTQAFHGRPLVQFQPGETPAAALDSRAWHLSADQLGESDYTWLLERFLETVDTTRVTTLVVGYTGYEGPDPAGPLLAHAASFPRLKALFLGDEALDQLWHADITPVFEGFPLLERLDVRGQAGLRLREFSSSTLKTLRFESCRLPGDVVRAVAASDLPTLEHLDLWLGAEDAGHGDLEEIHLTRILDGERLPALRHLGVENSLIQDDVARAIATAAVVPRLRSLSLALGTLTDRGAEGLLQGRPLTHLTRLDLHHHYLTEPARDRVRTALPGVDVNLDEAMDTDWIVWDEEGNALWDEEGFNRVAEGRDF